MNGTVNRPAATAARQARYWRIYLGDEDLFLYGEVSRGRKERLLTGKKDNGPYTASALFGPPGSVKPVALWSDAVISSRHPRRGILE